MSKYNSYVIDNDMWYKKRKDVYHLRPFSWVEEYFYPSNMSRKEFREILSKMNDPNAKYEET